MLNIPERNPPALLRSIYDPVQSRFAKADSLSLHLQRLLFMHDLDNKPLIMTMLTFLRSRIFFGNRK